MKKNSFHIFGDMLDQDIKNNTCTLRMAPFQNIAKADKSGNKHFITFCVDAQIFADVAFKMGQFMGGLIIADRTEFDKLNSHAPTPLELIDQFIEDLLGLRPRMTETDEKIELRLGHINPFVIGFVKAKHPDISLESAKFSAYTNLLASVAQWLKDPELLEKWRENEHVSQN